MLERKKESEILIRSGTLEHARRLAPRLRCSDRRELKAAGFEDFEGALVQSVMGSAISFAAMRCHCLVPCDKVHPCEVIAIWGVNPWSSRKSGGIWMLASDLLYEPAARRVCAKESREFVDKALPLFGRLENYVHAENKASVRWLKWLGFTMDEAAPYGPRGENFIHFYKALSDKQ